MQANGYAGDGGDCQKRLARQGRGSAGSACVRQVLRLPQSGVSRVVLGHMIPVDVLLDGGNFHGTGAGAAGVRRLKW